MSLTVTVTVTGDKRVLQKMKRLGSSLYNFKDAMGEIGKQGTEYFSGQAWLSQGGVFGAKWPPLAASTLKYRRQSVGTRGAQPLTTGHPDGMQFSFDSKSDSTSVVISNKKPYFKYHQSTAPRRHLPRRQMIGVSAGFKRIVQDIIKRDIEAKISHA